MKKCPLKAAAKTAGLLTYAGPLCLRGHSERYTYNGQCIACTKQRQKTQEYRARKSKQSAERWKNDTAFRVRALALRAEWEKLPAVRARKNTLRKWRRTGFTPELRAKLERHQQGLCYLTGKPPQKGKKLVNDHDHVTGLPRGLVRQIANTALGVFGDSAESLRCVADRIDNCPAKLFREGADLV